MKREVSCVNNFLQCINAEMKLNSMVKVNAEVKGKSTQYVMHMGLW